MGIIRAAYEIITEESAQEGDAEERGWENEEGEEYDLLQATSLIAGCEPSSTVYHQDIWYTKYGDMNYHDGTYTNYFYHLDKSTWSEEELKIIYAKHS